jgi:ribonuclease D
MQYEYIDSSPALQKAVARIGSAPVLGVDTEAAGYHRFQDSISLLQISTRDENLLIDPLAIPDLSDLAPLFLDPAIEKIFHDSDFDLRILHRDTGLEVRALFDTQVAAAFAGERQLGLGAVVEKYLGVILPKAYQRADWAERPLSAGMMEYAAMDTAYLPPLRERLLEELTRLGRTAWAEEEFTRRQTTRWSESEDNRDGFLRMKGARDLSPRGLAVLREIFAWRETVGKERDQATFRILSNQAMLEIAMKAPTTRAALRDVRGLPSALADRRWRELTEAVERGLAVPEGDLPRFPPSRRWERDPAAEERGERLRQVRNRIAEELNLDPGFLISRSLLDEIARRSPVTIDELAAIPDVRKWQIETLGGNLLEVVKN